MMKTRKNILFLFFFILPFTLFPTLSKRLYNFIMPPVSTFSQPNQDIANEALLDTTLLIQLYGYPAENHTVITDDGYLIVLHRIPRGIKNKTHSGIPVYLQHGAIVCSSTWVNNGEESWGFLLADEGYDVWMGNFRHNSYTKKLNKDYDDGGQIGWNTLSSYDVPAIVDYITNVTGHQKILVIGHSTGATVMLTTLSSNIEFSYKIKGLIALAPISNIKYSSSILFRIANLIKKFFPPVISYLYNESNWPSRSVRKDFYLRLCPADRPFLCQKVFDITIGYNPFSLMNKTRMSIYSVHAFDNYPDRFSFHWVQAAKYPKKMIAFDYGKEKNIDTYNQINPRSYDLKNIKVPVAVFYAVNDALASIIDVEIISRQLPNLIYKKQLAGEFTTHLDFIYHKPRQLVNSLLPVLSTMWQ